MNQKGFTLLELLVVITLLMIMIGLSIAFSSQYLQRQHLRAVAENVLTQVRTAQTASFGQVDDAEHGVAVFPDRSVEFTGSSYAARDPEKDDVYLFPSTMVLTNDTEIVFFPGDFKLERDYAITIQHELEQLTVIISQYGVLEIQEGSI